MANYNGGFQHEPIRCQERKQNGGVQQVCPTCKATRSVTHGQANTVYYGCDGLEIMPIKKWHLYQTPPKISE